MACASRRCFAVLLVAALCAGCGDDETSAEEVNVCDEKGTPYAAFAPGIVAEGAAFKVKLVSAIPNPPARGDNAWSAQLLDGGDAPTPDAVITRVKPFMPDHGHGANSPPEVGTVAADGMVQIDSIDFMMPGVWTIDFEVEVAGAADVATFAFCIDG